MKKEYTICYDDSYKLRVRYVFIPDEYLEKYFQRRGWPPDPPNVILCHQEAEEVLNTLYWLPKDFYVVRIVPDPIRCGLSVMISSKTFEEISEFEMPPSHLDRKNRKHGKKTI